MSDMTQNLATQDTVEKKVWHAPKCVGKAWKTPRIESLSFDATAGAANTSLTEASFGSAS